jgi:hypothetical protein
MNPVLNMMMNRLRSLNPQGYQTVNNLMQSGGNPKQLLQQLVGNADSNQIQQVLQQGKNMRCSTRNTNTNPKYEEIIFNNLLVNKILQNLL